jgi:hypothetical protein
MGVQVSILAEEGLVIAYIPCIEDSAHKSLKQEHHAAGTVVGIKEGDSDTELGRQADGMLDVEFELFLS